MSTREVTLMDLLHHQTSIGGIEAIARVAKDFSTDISMSGLNQALDAMNRVATAQRLGFVLEQLGLNSQWIAVASLLKGKHRNVQHLEPSVNSSEGNETLDSGWGILYNDSQENIFRELS